MVLGFECYYVKPAGVRGDSGTSPATLVGFKIQDIPWRDNQGKGLDVNNLSNVLQNYF